MDIKKITISDITSAEKLLGITYSNSEREQMVQNLEGQILSAKLRRGMELDNKIPMASKFDPRLPGFQMPSSRSVKARENSIKLPKKEEDIAFSNVGEQGTWIKNGLITSRKLTQIYLDRIEKFNSKLECFATVTKDQALAEADAMDSLTSANINLGPLHGIPYGLKDLFDTKGVRTGWGAEPYENRVPTEDAEIVKRLRAAGAVILGKTTLGALAYNDIWYGGRTKNPWNLNEGSSGSSAGSASATAAGLCSFAIGTETLGSITSPSQRCGTTGLRPTFGRVSRQGGMALCWSLDKVGPICRCVEDTGIVLSTLNGYDENDLSSISAPFNFDTTENIKDLVIGYLPEAFGKGATEVDREALKVATSLGAKVKEVKLEDLPYMSLINILYAEAGAAFEQLTLSNEDDTLTWQDDGAWPNTFRKARFLSAVDHVQLDRLRYLVMKALDNLFSEIDVLIGPFDTGPMLVASNFTGHPCLHLRAGFEQLASRGAASLGEGKLNTGEAGTGEKFLVPHGISLWGRLFEEEKILNFGMALEKELSVFKKRPEL
ncbi:MAG: amidase [Rhodobacterales bacterium]|jgi:Asp-tRNA(Asn)/Glu-tRNA(Gln) amidotransferase A subunit family amidase|tara:strand:+ start:424 stop:2067 length:1644 start_codon:yes stop_codon:yes gene_type:complete